MMELNEMSILPANTKWKAAISISWGGAREGFLFWDGDALNYVKMKNNQLSNHSLGA